MQADKLQADKSSYFLDVSESLSGQKWVDRLNDVTQRQAIAISQRHDLPELLARILASRDLTTDEIESYLNPKLKHLLPDPSSLKDMDAAAERIVQAIKGKQKIVVFGDYDVDGATSSALMKRFLKAVGSDAEIYIPDRIIEGYGPNVAAFDCFHSENIDLVICVDCGSVSFETFQHAQKIGLDVVVLDHHQCEETLPVTSALVNPNRQDDLSGVGHLAAVGVTYLCVIAINRSLREKGWYDGKVQQPDLFQWLDLVALGTVCDVVPLKGVNRAFVLQGLEIAKRGSNLGMQALNEQVRNSKPPDTHYFGFQIGPRINAGGRIGRADLGANLLSAENMEQSEQIAQTLERLNKERQEIESQILEHAYAEAEAMLGTSNELPCLLVSGLNWHPGIVGLIASRIKDRYRLPTIAIGFNEQGKGVGSGRSVPGIDLGQIVRTANGQGLLLKGGGHAMAAGLTIEQEKLKDFRLFFHEACETAMETESDAKDQLSIDGAVSAGGATISLVNLIEKAGPFGAGNPEPVFVLPSHRITFSQVVGNGHVRCSFASTEGERIDGIMFKAADTPIGQHLLAKDTSPVHVAGYLRKNFWQGQESVNIHIKDMAIKSMR